VFLSWRQEEVFSALPVRPDVICLQVIHGCVQWLHPSCELLRELVDAA
jgi:hypothetical protein